MHVTQGAFGVVYTRLPEHCSRTAGVANVHPLLSLSETTRRREHLGVLALLKRVQGGGTVQ